MAALSLALLGSLQVTVQGTPAPFESDKARALLAYLTVESGPHRRQALMGLLWPESPEDVARHNLRQTLYALRQAIGDHTAQPPYLLISRDEIQFNTASDYALDVVIFNALLAACDAHPHQGMQSCPGCAERLQQTVNLYRGEFLAQFFLSDSAPFEEWALVQRERLHQRALDALTQLADYYEQRAEHDEARRYALRQLDLDPWREEAHRQVMRVLAASGQRSAALVQYERCRSILSSELGVEPSSETRALYERISRSEFRPRASDIETGTGIPHPRLPVPLTPFVGRERELAELAQLLGDPECRLITLVGPGGIGKTHLALQLAIQHADSFTHGAAFVPLASLDSPSLIIPAIADASGIVFAGPINPKLQLLNYLRGRQMLLLVDNMEHLLEAVGLLTEILEQAPGVKVLVTSREQLNLQGEWVFDVSGLGLPADDGPVSFERSSAMALFLQRTRRAQAGFALQGGEKAVVARICRLVGGMPLAIELAAAWVRTLSLDEIEREIERGLDFLATSMRDVPERHHSMRAVFDHSWRLLTPEEQVVLARLSVFRGGMQREAAEAVAGAVLPLLSALLAKSLLRRTPSGRYDLHELVQQYAADRLSETPDEQAAARNRHSDYYLTLLRKCEPGLQSRRQPEILGELTLELDNLRLAWKHAAAHGQLSRLQPVAWPMFWYYELRNLLAEAESAFRQASQAAHAVALEPTNPSVDEIAAAHLRAFQAHFAHRQGRTAEAVQMLEQSLPVLRSSGDQAALADALWIYGTADWMMGELERASRHFGEALALELELKRAWPLADGYASLGYLHFDLGNTAEAERYLRQGLARSRELGDPTLTAFAIAGLCRTLRRSEQFSEMEALLEEGYQLANEAGNRLAVGLSLEQLAEIAWSRGDTREASRLYRESIGLYREKGDDWSLSRALNELGHLAWALDGEAQALDCFAEALEVARRGNCSAHALDAQAGIILVRTKGLGVEQALELSLQVLQHPSVSQQAKGRFERLRSELEGQLLPSQIEAARIRAMDRSLNDIVGVMR